MENWDLERRKDKAHEALDDLVGEIENLEKGGPIAIADHYVINDSNIEHMYEQVDKLLDDINFIV